MKQWLRRQGLREGPRQDKGQALVLGLQRRDRGKREGLAGGSGGRMDEQDVLDVLGTL